MTFHLSKLWNQVLHTAWCNISASNCVVNRLPSSASICWKSLRMTSRRGTSNIKTSRWWTGCAYSGLSTRTSRVGPILGKLGRAENDAGGGGSGEKGEARPTICPWVSEDGYCPNLYSWENVFEKRVRSKLRRGTNTSKSTLAISISYTPMCMRANRSDASRHRGNMYLTPLPFKTQRSLSLPTGLSASFIGKAARAEKLGRVIKGHLLRPPPPASLFDSLQFPARATVKIKVGTCGQANTASHVGHSAAESHFGRMVS